MSVGKTFHFVIQYERGEIMSDRFHTLIQSLRQGDSHAFDAIYQETHRVVYFSILGIIQDKQLAEDLLQDTFMRFLDYLPQYKNDNLISYLVTMGKRLAINEYHKRKRLQFTEETIDYIPAYDVYPQAIVQSEKRAIIDQALQALTQEERNIVILYNIANLTHKEISILLERPLGTITWLYQKALKKMQAAVKEVEE